ncbi:MAG TPA: class I SAM-dependent methyltransferase [Draconibacterium sp.]|nr:class I SAM-dependent methyltransferase [Draconibacterium sp.]
MNSFWNERFAVKEYVYGTEPNQFYKEELEKLKPGKILFPAEGEGRNAVFAAILGWDVTAFDSSIEGKKKAEKLANTRGINIQYFINNYENIQFEPESFDCLVLIYAHMHPLKRNEYHKKLTSFLKPGGKLILEGFSKDQINNSTGGPRDINMLFSEQELRNDFENLTHLSIEEADIILKEGQFHDGEASVIRVVGTR